MFDVASCINVRSRGAAGNGETNDYNAIQGAIWDAGVHGTDVFLPPGEYRIDYGPDDRPLGYPMSQVCGLGVSAKDIAITGAGARRTILKFPAAVERAFNGFSLDGRVMGGSRVEFRGLTLQGPEDIGPTKPNDGGGLPVQHETNAIKAYTPDRDFCGARPEFAVVLDDVRILGKWARGFLKWNNDAVAEPDDGIWSLCVAGSTISALCGSAVQTADTGMRHRLRGSDSLFPDCGLRAGQLFPGQVVTGHGWYVHPNVAIRFTRCVWTNGARYCVQHYGGDPVRAPEYAVIESCTVGDDCAQGFYLGLNGPARVLGTVFRAQSSALGIAGPVSVEDCEFGGAGPSIYPQGSRLAGARVSIRRSRFAGLAPGVIYIQSGAPGLLDGSRWTVEDCDFAGPGGASIGIYHRGQDTPDPATGDLDVLGCRFSGNWGSAISASRGRVRVLRNTFSGGSHSSGCVTFGGRALRSIEVSGNVFPGGRAVADYSGQHPECTLTGEGNAVLGGNGPWLAAGKCGALRLPRAAAPGSLDAAPALTLDLNHDSWRVAGTTPIRDIFLGSTAPATQLAFHGQVICLRFLGAGQLDAGGNIVPLQAGPRLAGDTVALAYDALDRVWTEVI